MNTHWPFVVPAERFSLVDGEVKRELHGIDERGETWIIRGEDLVRERDGKTRAEVAAERAAE